MVEGTTLKRHPCFPYGQLFDKAPAYSVGFSLGNDMGMLREDEQEGGLESKPLLQARLLIF